MDLFLETNIIKEILRVLESTIDQLKEIALKLKEPQSSDATKVTISEAAKKKQK